MNIEHRRNFLAHPDTLIQMYEHIDLMERSPAAHVDCSESLNERFRKLVSVELFNAMCVK